MTDEHHAAGHFGEECPQCGTVHRVLDSLPDQPLTRSQIQGLRDSDQIEFARGIMFMSGGIFGYDTDEELTEDVVLSTAASTKVLSHYDDTGWVVEMESEHADDDDPTEVGEQMWAEGSQHLSDAVNAAFRGEDDV